MRVSMSLLLFSAPVSWSPLPKRTKKGAVFATVFNAGMQFCKHVAPRQEPPTTLRQRAGKSKEGHSHETGLAPAFDFMNLAVQAMASDQPYKALL